MDYPAEFVEQLVGLSRSLAGDAGIALQRVADLAVEQLNGCDMAGVTLVQDGAPFTAVFTDVEAPEIDPGVRNRSRTLSRRVSERRHPAHRRDNGRRSLELFAAAAFSHGVRSTLSLPLRGKKHHRRAQPLFVGAHAFLDNEQMATVFVADAAAALASAQAYSASQALNEQLRAGSTRGRDRASQGRVDAGPPNRLRSSVRDAAGTLPHTNRKLRDVAAAIVDDATNGGDRLEDS